MHEVQELKRHIRWLEDQAEWNGRIGETVDEISSRLDTIEQGINKMVDVINNHNEVLRAVRDALNQIINVINKPVTPQPPSVFNELFSEVFCQTKRKPPPKRPSSKLKLVKKSDNAPPDQPA